MSSEIIDSPPAISERVNRLPQSVQGILQKTGDHASILTKVGSEVFIASCTVFWMIHQTFEGYVDPRTASTAIQSCPIPIIKGVSARIGRKK